MTPLTHWLGQHFWTSSLAMVLDAFFHWPR